MQTHWQLKGAQKLILFFSGWAMDETPTLYLSSVADVCTCFDYSDLNTRDIAKWSAYESIDLIAWSTGVWAAGQVLSHTAITLASATAINGTPTTVHNQTGIPVDIFTGTYANLSSRNMQKFQRRMVGNAANYFGFESVRPKRSIESSKVELGKILEFDFKNKAATISWDKAIVGLEDAIFPPENQQTYWHTNTQVIKINFPHYPFFNFSSWEEIISFSNSHL